MLAIAPYMATRLDDFESNERLFGGLFAEASWWSRSTDGPVRNTDTFIKGTSRPVPMIVYEVNLHTTQGSIPQTTLDAFSPSLGAGLAVADHMLIMLHDFAIRDQALFALAGYRYDRDDGKTALIWGVTRDMGVTDRKRPQYLALQLANEAIGSGGDMVRTSHTGDDPRWSQPLTNRIALDNVPYIQSFAFVNGSRRGVIVFNLHRTSALAVNFAGPNAPSGAVTMRRLTGNAITDTNENATSVSIQTSALASFDPSQPLTLPPFSMTVLVNDTAAPTMSLDRTSLIFGATTSGSGFVAQTSTQSVRLTQSGTGTVTWTAASNQPWLSVSPASGSGSGTLNVSVQFAAGLSGNPAGAITLTFAGAANTPGPISVRLNPITNGTSTGPTGAFDTPTDGTTGVTGSIAVTGWAMDDVEVTGVRILRDSIAGEPAGTLVFIGNATQVEGARPDVQALFPTAPRNTRAGWGYLMLTNFLPNLGNGTFRLTAIADDADGHATTLGTKTITCANSTATTPTGAIDTPVQGGTVSGTVTNFGWVLSPSPRRADPPGGGTVRLVIDGAFQSAIPTGWTSRSDLTALFPASQYPGIATALGVASFDSTPLANGVHTIAWVVTDIGSRYFTVSNGAGVMLDPGLVRLKAEATGEGQTIVARRGFDLASPYRTYEPDTDARVTIQSEELDRIELRLAPGSAGALRTPAGMAPLPAGSHLDAQTGTFTWQPGVAFVGPYDFAFATPGGRQNVRIVLNPKGSNRVGPQTVIDLPMSSNTAPVASAFTRKDAIVIGGWAADLDSTVDTGVDAVHVWAYPVHATGRHDDPIWIGAATYGGARPDVAAVYGDRYLTTGYGLTVRGLAPGIYDLAVFAYSTVRGGFGPAKTVRVTVP
jgi:hypothetical protein